MYFVLAIDDDDDDGDDSSYNMDKLQNDLNTLESWSALAATINIPKCQVLHLESTNPNHDTFVVVNKWIFNSIYGALKSK